MNLGLLCLTPHNPLPTLSLWGSEETPIVTIYTIMYKHFFCFLKSVVWNLLFPPTGGNFRQQGFHWSCLSHCRARHSPPLDREGVHPQWLSYPHQTEWSKIHLLWESRILLQKEEEIDAGHRCQISTLAWQAEKPKSLPLCSGPCQNPIALWFNKCPYP